MAHDLLIAWLNDAYAMENALIPILENHASDAQNDATAQARIRQHASETRRHAERVKECVERLGSSTSATKTGFATLVGYGQSVTTGIFSDELVKNSLMTTRRSTSKSPATGRCPRLPSSSVNLRLR